jgi:SAM-dependent methyltransferase
MIKSTLHWFMANPRIYDLVQRLVGARYVHRRLEAQVAPVRSASLILDLGGGTGINRDLWPPESNYVCLDLDPIKLRGYRSKYTGDFPVLGDATRIPIKTGSMDAILCAAVSHHIPDDGLDSLFKEAARSLKAGGRFIFLDAVWVPTRWPGRLMWKYDRGSYPRKKEALKALMEKYTDIVYWQEFSYLHKYILCVGTRSEASE